MEAYKNCVAVSICHGRAIIVGRIRVVVARHHHAKALALEFRLHTSRHLEHEVLFHRGILAARAGICAAVRRIENDYRTRRRRSLIRRKRSLPREWRRRLRRLLLVALRLLLGGGLRDCKRRNY